jgi:hypothetical protein
VLANEAFNARIVLSAGGAPERFESKNPTTAVASVATMTASRKEPLKISSSEPRYTAMNSIAGSANA